MKTSDETAAEGYPGWLSLVIINPGCKKVDLEQTKTLTAILGSTIATITALWKLPTAFRRWWDRRTLVELSGEAYSTDDNRELYPELHPTGLPKRRPLRPRRLPLHRSNSRTALLSNRPHSSQSRD
jgi:hypothetical protein